ncbi:hypothetical protein GCM10018785_48650 [Streptomyces longispororuber]|uniref:Uncharacterized protein n=1 Tax=Streptomyces longispororuber TaxID=68230 RepID=A0A919DTD6_9ACTN|nr:hypothetical protein [Streptomyces longispororuber]GHE74671.1 hypothetical protein GCM10018785_48650 [Streptomyces longispororuber]
MDGKRRRGRAGRALAGAAATAALVLGAPTAQAATPDPPTVRSSVSPSPEGSPRPPARMADTGAGVLPWLAAGGAAALGVGAVAFATTRRGPDHDGG